MSPLRTRLVSAAASLALLFTVAPALAPASAPEPAAAAQAPVKPKTIKKKPTKAQAKDLADLDYMFDRSLNWKTKTIDYKKADKFDHGRTTFRRKSVAWFAWGGGKIKNISKAERKKVRSYFPKRSHHDVRFEDKIDAAQTVSPLGASSVDAGPSRAPAKAGWTCTGTRKVIYVDSRIIKNTYARQIYLDSCAANVAQYAAGAGVIAFGVLAFYFPPSAEVALWGGAILGLGALTIELFQDSSSKDAVVIRDDWYNYTIWPQ